MAGRVPPITFYQSPKGMYDLRFFAGHYPYRDYYSVATTAAPTTYTFGTSARAVNNRNWPMLLDTRQSNESAAQNTYARSVMVQCTQDAFIIFSSVNPRYLRLYGRYLIEQLTVTETVARLAAEGITATITEVPTFIPANALMTFYPTYAAAITFYLSTVAGTIRIWAEGIQEGLE